MSKESRKFYEVTQNFISSGMYIKESDHRSRDVIYDQLTSYGSEILATTSSYINKQFLSKIYRYADGFLIEEAYARTFASMDCYMTSLIPVIISDEVETLHNYFYLKVHSRKKCVDFEKSDYYQDDIDESVFSFFDIAIQSEKINEKDKIFFIDDGVTILMDEEVMAIFEQKEIEWKSVALTQAK
jgi:hypothetical protein